MTDINANCHCGSHLKFSDCCEPILFNAYKAQTAEQLMRSRFSAFYSNNIDYLIATHHPSKREAGDKKNLLTSNSNCVWLNLKIISKNQGEKSHNSGEVEFIATYKQLDKNKDIQLCQLHENSRFIKENDQWFYLDGELSSSVKPIKWKRNAPCWCNSGKKYKQCHGL
jgi:SEC-C motif-containing protein